VFSVLLPASNAVVESDMAALRPAGVTNQSYRFPFPGLPDTVEDLIDLMRPTLDLALACQPDRIVVAYTPEYMAESVTASRRLRAFIEDATDLPATTASDGVATALNTLGARRIGLVTPYPPEANRNLEAYFASLGFSIVGAAGLGSAQERPGSTSRITEAAVREAFARVDKPEVEVLLQVGTALVCAGFVADLESLHGKPVLAVNTATYWLALRQHGIADRLDHFGILLKDH
jgi:maleate isomerase